MADRRHDLLIDMTDDELRHAYRQIGAMTTRSLNSVTAEMDRRAAAKSARENRIMSIVGLVIAVAAIVIAALKP